MNGYYDPDMAAAATAALVDGLLLHLLTDPSGLPADTAIAVLDARLRAYVDIDDHRDPQDRDE